MNLVYLLASLALPHSASRPLHASRDVLYADFYPQLQDPPSPLIADLMHTDLFRRLDRVSQLGTKKFLFPHANITRGAHCRGTRTMASIYVNILNRNSPDDQRITPTQSHAIQAAALLHDIGHGPYSHIFQSAAAHILQATPWSHEEQSARIARHLFHAAGLVQKHGLPPDFVDAVVDMIRGINKHDHAAKYASSPDFATYAIFTIVNSDTEASLDVDKFDYMRRDSHMCCRPRYAALVDRAVAGIIENSRIAHDRIVYSVRAAESLVVFAHCAYLNYRYLYHNPQACGLDLLVQDILACELPHTDLVRLLHDMPRFSAFDDSFVESPKAPAADPRLKNLRARFNARVPYEFIGYLDHSYPADTSPAHGLAQLHSSAAAAIQAFDDALRTTHPAIGHGDYVFATYNFARILKRNGTKNILEKVSFHDAAPDRPLPRSHNAHLRSHSLAPGSTPLFDPADPLADPATSRYETDHVPFYWGSVQLRLYARTTDPNKIGALKKLFGLVIN